LGRNKSAKPRQRPKVIPLQMDANFFYERAVRSLDRFHYEKALKYFRRAVEFEPDNPVNHCNMAGILSEMGQYGESNKILQHIVDRLEPRMTECYFYMANNYANMEDYESAERMLAHYLEHDRSGQFLEEAHELIELLSYELERPLKLRTIKSREEWFEHDKARALLEQGHFAEAARLLEKLVRKRPDLLAARNNLALAYYYVGEYERSVREVFEVLRADPGNLHALCNLAVFIRHFGKKRDLDRLIERLKRIFPFHQEHLFKLATTLGILQEHEAAYRHFKRLVKSGAEWFDPSLYHYTAVAAYNTGRREEALRLWKKAARHDAEADLPRFFASALSAGPDPSEAKQPPVPLSYHYHFPFMEEAGGHPLARPSFFWALKNGDFDSKLQALQAYGKFADGEAEEAVRQFLLAPEEDDYLKRMAAFALRAAGAKGPIHAVMGGRGKVDLSRVAPNLPRWEEKWQRVMEIALRAMDKRYDMVQQLDLQTLWVEFLTRSYPEVPSVGKVEGWAAALEYLTAKMHRRDISYREVSARYGVSEQTVMKNARAIDNICGLREKMAAIMRIPGG